jgi:multicomponent Na+:H+ antiporter subunit D
MLEGNLPATVVVAPLVAAIIGLLLSTPSYGRRFVLAIAAAAQVWLSFLLWRTVDGDGTMVLRLGGWMAPYGIALVVDSLAALMLLFCSFTTLVSILYGYAEKFTAREHPLRVPLIFLLLSGVNLSLVTGDLFNLFVAFEVMLLASYALFTLESNADEVPIAMPYVAINLIASTLFLVGAGLAYAWLGTLNFAQLIERMSTNAQDPRLFVLAGLFLLVFTTKAGLFPLMYWLPRAYPVLPGALAALFGGLLTKVGVYVLIRFTGTVLPHNLELLHGILLWMGAVTMVLGGLGALAQYRVQAILTWHIVSQIGFMVVALALMTPVGVAAALLITLHNIFVKSSLMLCGGTIGRLFGTDDVRRCGHLWLVMPGFGLMFLLQSMSLAGIPPLSGFWGKWFLFEGLVEQERWVLVALAAIGSFLTLASMLKIWLGAFWSTQAVQPKVRVQHRWQVASIGLLCAAALGCGPLGGWFVAASKSAGMQALDRDAYVRSVKTANEEPFEDKMPRGTKP